MTTTTTTLVMMMTMTTDEDEEEDDDNDNDNDDHQPFSALLSSRLTASRRPPVFLLLCSNSLITVVKNVSRTDYLR